MLLLRRDRDSNPRNHISGSTDFESAPIDHSGNSPIADAKIILSGIYFPSRTYFFEKHSDGTPSKRPDAHFFTIRQHRPEKKLSLPCKGFRIALSTAIRELKGNAVRIGNSPRCCKFQFRKE